MIEAGEDARYIARRMIVHACEDIGLADPRALLVAVAAAHAVEHVGLPEARLNLAEAAIYLARAPKSNSVISALARAIGGRGLDATRSRCTCATRATRAPAARPRQGLQVPARLSRATSWSRSTGPARFSGNRYYEPSGEGEETGES